MPLPNVLSCKLIQQSFNSSLFPPLISIIEKYEKGTENSNENYSFLRLFEIGTYFFNLLKIVKIEYFFNRLYAFVLLIIKKKKM
jgi:hypothetical protein